jgi:hypothetical protein
LCVSAVDRVPMWPIDRVLLGYPTKSDLLLELLAQFKVHFHGLQVKAILADYRYIVATDLSWRYLDIVQNYILRWLIEVFFEDWKLYEGWGQLAKQTGEEGSSRGLILSLLLDHRLLLHPEQTARLENNLPACTVGSLCEKSRGQALLAFI